MRFRVEDRTIQQNNSPLGVQGDNGVETVEFVLPRYYGDIDLNQGFAYAVFRLPDKTEDFVKLDKTENNEELILTWLVGSQITERNGIIELGLKISGLDGILWGSKITSFLVERSIPFKSPQQPFLRSARNVVPLMDNNGILPLMDNPANEPPITVTERKINIPAALQTIAVQNDANSETAQIQMPRYFDGHDLYKYSIYLKTVMPDDNGRDDIPLAVSLLDSQTLTMPWTLKPPQTSYSGSLGLQIYVVGTRSDGKEFKWETLDASITIARSLDAEPVIPTQPSVFDEFVKQISGIKNEAKASELNAKASETNAKASANAAAASAKQAKSSEENAKKSETSAAGSLTDINTGLAGKLPIADANGFIKSVSLDENTGIFTFTRYDNSTFTIDTALEKAVLNFRYDAERNQLVLVTDDGHEYRIDMASFTNIYVGQESATVNVSINGNKILAEIKGNSISLNLLDEFLLNTINSKVTANAEGNASQIKFSDGKTMQEKLDAGDFNGKDGICASIDGMFYMRVDEFGHLKVGVNDGAERPPLSIKEGHLIYTIS